MRNTMKSKRAGKHKEGEIFDKNEMVARCPSRLLHWIKARSC